MDKKHVYVEKLEAQLREWDGMRQVIKARFSKSAANAKLDGIDVLERLEKQRAELARKVDELKASADDSWEAMKAQLEQHRSHLESGLGALKEKMGLSHHESGDDPE